MKRDKLLLNGKYTISVKTNGDRTYKALCNIDGIVPVIKIYNIADVSRSAVDFDQKEVDTAARGLLQPNLVKYIEAFTDKEHFYVVMEYVPNSMDQIISHQRSTERLAALYITQIIKGLIFIHYNGYTHKRITPEHILITNEGFVKIGDFLLQDTYLSNGSKAICDQAPEELLLLGRTTAIDIWNVGLLLFNCLTQEHLFGKMSDQEILLMFQSKQAQTLVNNMLRDRLTECDLKVSQNCLDFMLACLCVNYTERPSAQKILQAPFLRQINTEIARGKIGASTLRENRIDERQALNDASAGIAELKSHIPVKNHSTIASAATNTITTTATATAAVTTTAASSARTGKQFRPCEKEDDSKTVSSGFNKQDQEILKQAILNIPSVSEDNRSSRTLRPSDANTAFAAAMWSPERESKAISYVPATGNFPMQDEHGVPRQKPRAKSNETGPRQPRKVKHRNEVPVDKDDNKLDESSFDLQDIKVFGKLELRKYENSTKSDNFSDLLNKETASAKAPQLLASGDHTQSRARLNQTGSMVSSSALVPPKKGQIKALRAGSRPIRNNALSAGDDIFNENIGPSEKQTEKAFGKYKKTQRAVSGTFNRGSSKTTAYYKNNQNNHGNTLPTDGTTESGTLATELVRKLGRTKSKTVLPDNATPGNLKDCISPANKGKMQKADYLTPSTALDNQWDSNSCSSEELFLETDRYMANRNMRLQIGLDDDDSNSDSGISRTSAGSASNNNISRSQDKSNGDGISQCNMDRLITSFSRNSSAPVSPKNPDKPHNFDGLSIQQGAIPHELAKGLTASTNASTLILARRKKAPIENDINESYNFFITHTDGKRPITLKVGNSPLAKRIQSVSGDSADKALKQDNAQNDELTVNFDNLIPKDHDVAALIRTRQLMLHNPVETCQDDTSSAFSSVTSTATHLDKKNGCGTPDKGISLRNVQHSDHSPSSGKRMGCPEHDVSIDSFGGKHGSSQCSSQKDGDARMAPNTSIEVNSLHINPLHMPEENSVLIQLNANISDSSSQDDVSDDLVSNYPFYVTNQSNMLYRTHGCTEMEELRSILTNYKISNKLSVLSVKQVCNLILSSRRCFAYVKDMFAVHFWFIKLKDLVDRGCEEAILILVIISTISFADFNFCRDIFLMGLIPLIDRLYITYPSIISFLDQWTVPLLVRLIIEYENDDSAFRQRIHPCTCISAEMSAIADNTTKKPLYGGQSSPNGDQKAESHSRGHGYAVMRILESIIVTHTTSFILRLLFAPIRDESSYHPPFDASSTANSSLMAIINTLENTTPVSVQTHELAYNILLILFRSKTIFKSEILYEILHSDLYLLDKLMKNIDKSVLYIFLLQEFLFMGAMQGTIYQLFPTFFAKLSRMMNAYENMYIADSHGEDDYYLSASLYIDFSVFSAGMQTYAINISGAPSADTTTCIEVDSLKYNLTVLLTAITHILISLNKLAAEPCFSSSFREQFPIFVRILEKSEEYGNAVPYALSSLNSLVRRNPDSSTSLIRNNNIIKHLGRIINGKTATNRYSLQFSIPFALTIVRTININEFPDDGPRDTLIWEVKNNLLKVFLHLIETSSVWRKQCLDSLAHIVPSTTAFEQSISGSFKLTLNNLDYKETLPSILVSLLSLAKSSKTICAYLAGHKELATGVAYLLKHSSGDATGVKLNALKLCLELSSNYKDTFLMTYGSTLSTLSRFRDTDTDQFVLGKRLSKQILDALQRRDK